ncbi:MAG: hypothetical protein ABI700_14560 [Chloroflexota bacterium]
MSFQRRLDRIDAQIQRLSLRDNRYIWARLIVFFVGGLGSVILLTFNPVAGWLTLLIAVAIFSVVIHKHRKVRRTLAQFRMWRDIKTEHQARSGLEWKKLPPALPPLSDRDHPFAADLDLIGDRSLHHLLDATVALESAVRLRDRLLTTPDNLETVSNRQALVQELVPLAHLRDRLTLSARLIVGKSRRWDSKRLSGWLAQPPPSTRLRRTLIIAASLALCDAILFLLNQAGLLPPLWIVTFLAYFAVLGAQGRNSDDSFELATELQSALEVLVEIVRRLETTRFTNHPHLQALCSPFQSIKRPTAQLRRAMLLATAAGVQKNFVLAALLNSLIPWDLFIAYQLQRYRTDLAVYLPIWLDAWFEFETASAIANFADLNPNCTFPSICENAIFHAVKLGHPLIPARVSNDFTLERLGDVALITGSNMSGKSSFLRTVGINLCMAYAGAPVCSETLEVGLFRLYTSILVSDSLADGFSYFYAEVRRLRALLTALEMDTPLPLFFLIDEIFRGTNNQERLIGSRSYVHALVGKHGIGLISTHDLELTALPGLINYHFEDQVVEGQMSFDYHIRSGASPTTNALKIMRLAGLPVED